MVFFLLSTLPLLVGSHDGHLPLVLIDSLGRKKTEGETAIRIGMVVFLTVCVMVISG